MRDDEKSSQGLHKEQQHWAKLENHMEGQNHPYEGQDQRIAEKQHLIWEMASSLSMLRTNWGVKSVT